MDYTKILVPAIAGLLTGIIGSFIAPWAKWGIEKRKLRLENKKELLAESRTKIVDQGIDNEEFMSTVVYSRIREYLSESLIKDIEGTYTGGLNSKRTINVVVGSGRNSGVNPFKNKLLDELTMLEKKWKLI